MVEVRLLANENQYYSDKKKRSTELLFVISINKFQQIQ